MAARRGRAVGRGAGLHVVVVDQGRENLLAADDVVGERAGPPGPGETGQACPRTTPLRRPTSEMATLIPVPDVDGKATATVTRRPDETWAGPIEAVQRLLVDLLQGTCCSSSTGRCGPCGATRGPTARLVGSLESLMPGLRPAPGRLRRRPTSVTTACCSAGHGLLRCDEVRRRSARRAESLRARGCGGARRRPLAPPTRRGLRPTSAPAVDLHRRDRGRRLRTRPGDAGGDAGRQPGAPGPPPWSCWP